MDHTEWKFIKTGFMNMTLSHFLNLFHILFHFREKGGFFQFLTLIEKIYLVFGKFYQEDRIYWFIVVEKIEN